MRRALAAAAVAVAALTGCGAPEVRKASSITAAEFLRNFVGDIPWVHMDIAGTAWGLGRPYAGKGASGFGVRSLIELARRTGGSV